MVVIYSDPNIFQVQNVRLSVFFDRLNVFLRFFSNPGCFFPNPSIHYGKEGVVMSGMKGKELAWRLYGTGLENLRKDELDIPEPSANEILVHVDAVGLCFSDLKIIRAGASHPKLWWKNLEERPLTPGHEAVLTIVKTGSGIPEQYKAGQRFLIQCDIYIKGRSCAFGYGMNGAYAEYQIIDERVWKGEEKSYLIPIPDYLSAAGTALIEPWSCVRGAYLLNYRRTPLAGGKVLAAAESNSAKCYKAGTLFVQNKPASMDLLNFSQKAADALSAELSIPVNRITEIPENAEYDDIICCDITDSALLEQVIGHTAWRGTAGFLGRTPSSPCKIDVGALHYCHRYYQGVSSGDFSELYRTECRNTLKKGGYAWFPGGAGAMGQMHVELALEENGPTKILVSDFDDVRLVHLEKKLSARAEKQGKIIKFVNPKKYSAEEFDSLLKDFALSGFDDVVILVPSVGLAEQVMHYLNDGALMNFFAGIPAGTPANLNIGDFVDRGIRLIGSSGSSFDDMFDTLQMSITSGFRPQNAMAAIGGMNALKDGLEAVAAGKFPGKTVILPGCPDLPLTLISELGKLDPALPETLDENGAYTKSTEESLLRKWSRK